MLDLKLIREHAEDVKQGVRRKGLDPSLVDEAMRLDEERRKEIQHAEMLKSRKNTVSAQVAKMKAKGEDASAVIAEMRGVADEIKAADDQLRSVEERLQAVMLSIPNIPHPSVPDGEDPGRQQGDRRMGRDTCHRLHAEAALGAGGKTEDHRFRPWHEDHRRGFSGLCRERGATGTRAHQLLPGSERRTWIHRADAPLNGQ